MAADAAPELREFDPEWLVRRGNYLTLITPDVAKELLDRNTNNRRPKTRAIQKYVRDMQAGKWDPDASDIKVARTGELLDGQNRLLACVEADVPFPTLLRTGLHKDTRNHVDTGVARSIADAFQMAGVAHHTHVAAAVMLRARYEHGMQRGNTPWLDRRINYTHAEALDYLERHPTFTKVLVDAQGMYSAGSTIPRSVYIAGLSMMAESSEKKAREFADTFIHGDMHGIGDPLLAFTRYLATAKLPRTQGRVSRAGAERHLLALITAWNAWRQDEKLERIHMRDTDPLVPAA